MVGPLESGVLAPWEGQISSGRSADPSGTREKNESRRQGWAASAPMGLGKGTMRRTVRTRRTQRWRRDRPPKPRRRLGDEGQGLEGGGGEWPQKSKRTGPGGGGGWPAGSGRRDDRKGVSGSGGCGWVTFTLLVQVTFDSLPGPGCARPGLGSGNSRLGPSAAQKVSGGDQGMRTRGGPPIL